MLLIFVHMESSTLQMEKAEEVPTQDPHFQAKRARAVDSTSQDGTAEKRKKVALLATPYSKMPKKKATVEIRYTIPKAADREKMPMAMEKAKVVACGGIWPKRARKKLYSVLLR